MTKKNKKSILFKTLVISGILLIIAGVFTIYKAYQFLYKPNVKLNGKKSEYLYIRTTDNFDKVANKLTTEKIISDSETFEWLSDFKDYKAHVKPGKYLITDGMNNNELINMLKSGRQEPVNLVFNNVRTKYQLAGKIAKQLEADSLSVINILNDSIFLKKFGFTLDNAIVIFIPNTYEIYWNTSASQLFERMNSEFKKFWNDNKKEKAKKAGLTPIQVEILASIVQEETRVYEEMPKVAGLYINRLNKGMKLEADPTVKFAINDFTIKRILTRHLEVNSTYNTYKNIGLPPGPICLPDPRVINKVLEFEKHNYIYMCAKPDNSGCHAFAKTGAEHGRNAAIYHQYLNRLKIK